MSNHVSLSKDALWYWVGGSLSFFRNWATGEPNGEERELCTEMYVDTGEWNDHFCDAERGYVCKVRKEGNTFLSF